MSLDATIAAIPDATLVALGAAAAIDDVRARRVSNATSLSLAGSGLVVALLHGGALASITGIAMGLAILTPAFAAGWVGGGDVKLLAGLGAWLGPTDVLITTAVAFAATGVIAFAMALRSGAARRTLRRVGASLATATPPLASRERALIVPLALPLVLAAIAVRGVAP